MRRGDVDVPLIAGVVARIEEEIEVCMRFSKFNIC
jgi:hypothetical protein